MTSESENALQTIASQIIISVYYQRALIVSLKIKTQLTTGTPSSSRNKQSSLPRLYIIVS